MENPELRNLRFKAQEALDELWHEKAIPFALKAQQIHDGPEEGFVIIHFFDSRLHSVNVQLKPVESFKQNVREAVLERFMT
jgi:hypothetical protein